MQEVSRERRGPWLAAPPVPQFPASPGSVMNVLCTALGRHAGQLIRSAAQHVDLTDAYMPLKAQMPRLDPGLRRSVVMSVSSEADPEGGQGPGRVAGVAPSAARTGWGASAAHSAIAVIEPHDPGSPCPLTLSVITTPTAHRDKPQPASRSSLHFVLVCSECAGADVDATVAITRRLGPACS
jgi:hypothetical protein